MKKCSRCGELKSISEFYARKNRRSGLYSACKACHWEAGVRWRRNNPQKTSEISRRSQAKNREIPGHRLSRNVSSDISHSLRGGAKAGRHWEDLVGYTKDQLRKHLEKQFRHGMTWDNYGPYWHVDHKIPITAFNFERPEDEDFRLCWSLKNLQPLEAKANISKHNKVDKPHQPSLAM